MMTSILLHLLLPLSLAGWAIGFPARSIVGRAGQLGAFGSVVFALGIAGVWLFPPWWVAWVCAGAFIAAALWSQRRPLDSFWPTGTAMWLLTAVSVSLGAYALREAVLGLMGRRPPDAMIVDLGNPFRAGRFLVVNGGSTRQVNSHVATLDESFAGHHDYRGQSFGVDLVQLNRWGGTSNGIFPQDPRRWRSYGEHVVAPCEGIVKLVHDGAADTPVPVPDRKIMAGNFVLLDCGAFEVLLAHLAPGSIAVEGGQAVDRGRLLGRVGNTGNTSVPHLHIHAQLPSATAAPLAGEPLAMRIEGRFLVRGNHLVADGGG